MLGEWVPTTCHLQHLGNLLAFVFSYSNRMDIFFIIPFMNRSSDMVLLRGGRKDRRWHSSILQY